MTPASGVARAAALALVVFVTAAPWVLAAEPTSAPATASQPPSCAERYPADGPAGVDLQLGCVVNAVVSSYLGRGGGTGEPPRLSGYLAPILVAALAAAAMLVAARAVRRRAGSRLAPVVPQAWWSCPACRSLNSVGSTACYSCGQPFEPNAAEVRADADAPAPQSFGRRIDLE